MCRRAPRPLLDHQTFRLLSVNREWLAANLDRRLSLAEAASHAGFSPFHYQRLFVRAFGESPHAFLTRLRMERAKDIQRSSTDPVTDVCLTVGYESLGTFSSRFSREVGVSPGSFRRVFATPGLWELKSTPACYRSFR